MLLVLMAPMPPPPAGPADLPGLRVELAASEDSSRLLAERAADAALARDTATQELDRAKRAVHEGNGGFFAERRVRTLSASVRELVEAAILADQQARAAAAALEERRRLFRSALFSAASERTGQGDAEARAGRTADAASRYGEAGRLLAEASRVPAETSAPDPWKGLAVEIPDAGVDPAAVADAYREIAEHISQLLEELAPELEAAERASAAWERLARFQGVLERAGAAAADPRPLRDMLRSKRERGLGLRERALSRAQSLESGREVGP